MLSGTLVSAGPVVGDTSDTVVCSVKRVVVCPDPGVVGDTVAWPSVETIVVWPVVTIMVGDMVVSTVVVTTGDTVVTVRFSTPMVGDTVIVSVMIIVLVCSPAIVVFAVIEVAWTAPAVVAGNKVVWSTATVLVWSAATVLVWSTATVLVWSSATVLVWSAATVLVWSSATVLVWSSIDPSPAL